MEKTLVGEKFGRLTVIEKTKERNKERYLYYKVKCDCGNEEKRTSKALNAAKRLNSDSCCLVCAKALRLKKQKEKMEGKHQDI